MTFKKPLNQHVMTARFREGLTQAYSNALAKLKLKPEDVKPHIVGSCTVVISTAELETLRKHYGDKMLELSLHRNNGAIEIFLPEGEAYIAKNRPTMTAEERAAKASKGIGINREEADRRKRAKADLRARLKGLHGINLDGDDDEEEGDEADE